MKKYKVHTNTLVENNDAFDVSGDSYNEDPTKVTVTVSVKDVVHKLFIPWNNVKYIEELRG